jgi:hypothetical protein
MKLWKIIAVAALALATPAFAANDDMVGGKLVDILGIMNFTRFTCHPFTLTKNANPIMEVNILLTFQIYGREESGWDKKIGEPPKFDDQGSWVPNDKVKLDQMIVRHKAFSGVVHTRNLQYHEANPTTYGSATKTPSFTWIGSRGSRKNHYYVMSGNLHFSGKTPGVWNYEETLRDNDVKVSSTPYRCELDDTKEDPQ